MQLNGRHESFADQQVCRHLRSRIGTCNARARAAIVTFGGSNRKPEVLAQRFRVQAAAHEKRDDNRLIQAVRVGQQPLNHVENVPPEHGGRFERHGNVEWCDPRGRVAVSHPQLEKGIEQKQAPHHVRQVQHHCDD